MNDPANNAELVGRVYGKLGNPYPKSVFKGTNFSTILTPANNVVLFQDVVSKALNTVAGGILALHQLDTRPYVRSDSYRPTSDEFTLLRLEILLELIASHLGTYDKMASSEYVEVVTITGEFTSVPSQNATASEFLRKLVRGATLQAGSATLQAGFGYPANAALNSITFHPQET